MRAVRHTDNGIEVEKVDPAEKRIGLRLESARGLRVFAVLAEKNCRAGRRGHCIQQFSAVGGFTLPFHAAFRV